MGYILTSNHQGCATVVTGNLTGCYDRGYLKMRELRLGLDYHILAHWALARVLTLGVPGGKLAGLLKSVS